LAEVLTDREFIESENWPYWPVLPVVERDYTFSRRYGLIFSSQHCTVYIGINFWDTLADLSDAERQTYESIDALLKDWRID